jgi:hypothetical protein
VFQFLITYLDEEICPSIYKQNRGARTTRQEARKRGRIKRTHNYDTLLSKLSFITLSSSAPLTMKRETSNKNILEKKINSLIPESLLFFFHNQCANNNERKKENKKSEKNERMKEEVV